MSNKCSRDGCNVIPRSGIHCSKHRSCIFPKCKKSPTFGKEGTTERKYCLKHKPDDSYIDVKNKKCIFLECTKQATFGDEKIKKYCADHKPNEDYINLRNKRCISKDCDKLPTYGKEGTVKREYCFEHKPKDYVNVKDKKCIRIDCKKGASYGKRGTKIKEYCKDHKLDTYICLGNKICIHPNCEIIPTYGKKGTKIPIYCTDHNPKNGYINVKNKICLYLECETRATFGKKETKIALYCKEHIPDDDDIYVDVKNKKCISLNCDILASYYKKETKIKEYCAKHKLDGYINIDYHKKCKFENCEVRASYGFIGYSPIYCATHKEKSMITNSLVKCFECGRVATKVYDKQYSCDEHSLEEAIDIYNICPICCIIKIEKEDKICESCSNSMKDGKTVNRRLKELTVKMKIENSDINIDSYDKKVSGGCSYKRPDFMIKVALLFTIIIEVDEHQHQRSTYSCECEIKRMKQIYHDIGIENGKVLFIRYNPDKYKPSYGQEYNETKRLDSLVRTIRKYQRDGIENHLEVLYLFYDGYTQKQEEKEIIDPY